MSSTCIISLLIFMKETTSKKEKVIEYLSFLKGAVLMRHCHRQKRHFVHKSLFTSFKKRLQKECNCAKDTGRTCTNSIHQHMVDGQSGHQDKGRRTPQTMVFMNGWGQRGAEGCVCFCLSAEHTIQGSGKHVNTKNLLSHGSESHTFNHSLVSDVSRPLEDHCFLDRLWQ